MPPAIWQLSWAGSVGHANYTNIPPVDMIQGIEGPDSADFLLLSICDNTTRSVSSFSSCKTKNKRSSCSGDREMGSVFPPCQKKDNTWVSVTWSGLRIQMEGRKLKW